MNQLTMFEAPRAREYHGHGTRAKTPTYRSWQHMRDRCMRVNSDSFSRYGARGITICERWRSFEAFLVDMGERPDGTSLDRKDGSRGYSPENCRWATQDQQSQNTTRCKLTPALVAEIRELQGTTSSRKLAPKYGVSNVRISAIWRGVAWRVTP